MSAEAVSIARAAEADLPEILALNRLIQPHLKRSLELLLWQYFQTPARDSRIYLAREPQTKSLIASYGAVSQWLQVGSARVKGWMIQDVMTHPDYRGKGLLHTLAAVCFEEMKRLDIAGYTFPNERSQMSFSRIGWKRAALVPSREVELRAGHSRSPFTLTPVPVDDLASAGTIWGESGLPLGVARDAEFLAWRYRKPGERYTLCSDGRDYVAALKLFDGPDGRALHVLDLYTRRTVQSRVPELLAACLDFGVQQGAVRATAWLPADHPYAAAFDANGLALKERPERFFYTHFPATVAVPPPYWHLTQGDSDVY